MLWEANDLMDENRIASPYSQEARMLPVYDEFGDPYAMRRQPEPVRFAKIWGSPVSIMGASFLFAILVGSLFRSLVKGVASLVLLLLLVSFLVGQGALLQFFDGTFGREFVHSVETWIDEKGGIVKQYLLSYLPASSAAGVGFVVGLLK